MIHVTDAIRLDESELALSFVHAGGPGGQHVNKSATAVQLRFDVASSPSLPADVRARLLRLAGSRVTADGILVLTARRHRSQERNRQEVVDRLVSLIRQAARPPKKRRPTKPTKASRERRLAKKKQQSRLKKSRRSPRLDDT
jgi:ribosome-associated protein